jgi:hypothetical protein
MFRFVVGVVLGMVSPRFMGKWFGYKNPDQTFDALLGSEEIYPLLAFSTKGIFHPGSCPLGHHGNREYCFSPG